ncbi:MAG: MiaB/RimO family radical SAM methylthiotransferase [Acidobacteria bacterium]|nr:MiaB/RimO family radical SAM methylthiotransferase [Acidobacteriota bacterium]
MFKYSVLALGCKVSQIDASLAGASSGGERVTDPAAADVIVVQTCSVTERADRDDRKLIRRLRRENPSAVIVATGCLAERDPQGLARMPGVDLVAGHGFDKGLSWLLVERSAGRLDGKIAPSSPPGSSALTRNWAPDAVENSPGHTRAFLKIQDGCERRCSFCIVPRLRGSERSVPVQEVAQRIRQLGDSGIPEVVLAGVHLANFGKDAGSSLSSLIGLLERNPPACRVRLSSLEPMEAGEEVIDAICGSRVITPHLHLPLQSGSNAVLRRMRRGMTAERYIALAGRALASSPSLHLATDLITGFPGETDDEFAETLALAEKIPFASLHVFPFSPRSGTHAASLAAADPVPAHVIFGRARRLRALGEEKALAFARRFDGSCADVVSLSGGRGLTANYLDVRLRNPGDVTGEPGLRFAARLAFLPDAPALEAWPLIDCRESVNTAPLAGVDSPEVEDVRTQ